MKIREILSIITFKDWLIIVTVSILVSSIIQIRKLKKTLVQEVHRRLVPELAFDLDLEEVGLFIKNESCLIAKDVQVEDLKIDLEDYGFVMHFILKFEQIETLRPKERVKLKFKIFREDGDVPSGDTEGIIPHLVNASFRIKVHYANIENLNFGAEYLRKANSFSLEKLESYP